MKLALSALLLFASTSAFAQSHPPGEFTGLLALNCSATINGKTRPVIETIGFGKKGVEVKLKNVRVAHKSPKYLIKFSAYAPTEEGAKFMIFADGIPQVQDELDTVLNRMYLEVENEKGRIGHGGEWLDLKDVKCDVVFAG